MTIILFISSLLLIYGFIQLLHVSGLGLPTFEVEDCNKKIDSFKIALFTTTQYAIVLFYYIINASK